MSRIRPASAEAAVPLEGHPTPGLLSDFILGSQDGLVNVLGILLGLASAGEGRAVILVATVAALAAETISMAAVAYTSTRARRQFYLAEQDRERWEMEHLPDAERQEVREILDRWGFEGEEREDLLDRIVRKPKAMLDLMMAFELHLAPVSAEQPQRSALIVGLATVVGSVIPILPFLLTANVPLAAAAAVVLAGGMLFAIGWYEARTTVGSLWRSGLRMLVIGLAAGFAGFLVGILLHDLP
ncbi:MAG: VIT1/CCC1 transporter family protein [Thermoplasmata archaeon]